MREIGYIRESYYALWTFLLIAFGAIAVDAFFAFWRRK